MLLIAVFAGIVLGVVASAPVGLALLLFSRPQRAGRGGDHV